MIKNNPKIIAGISDACTLLNPMTAKTGLVTFNGLEFMDLSKEPMDYTFDSVKKAWFDGTVGNIQQDPNWHDHNGNPSRYDGWTCVKPGAATGMLVGGNDSSYFQLRNTDYDIPMKGNILFHETYMRSKRDNHFILDNLRMQGYFDEISGMVVGYLSGSDNTDGYYPAAHGNDRTLVDMVLEATEGYDFPILHVGEFGHLVDNFLQPIGTKIDMDATNLKLSFPEQLVS